MKLFCHWPPLFCFHWIQSTKHLITNHNSHQNNKTVRRNRIDRWTFVEILNKIGKKKTNDAQKLYSDGLKCSRYTDIYDNISWSFHSDGVFYFNSFTSTHSLLLFSVLYCWRFQCSTISNRNTLLFTYTHAEDWLNQTSIHTSIAH